MLLTCWCPRHSRHRNPHALQRQPGQDALWRLQGAHSERWDSTLPSKNKDLGLLELKKSKIILEAPPGLPLVESEAQTVLPGGHPRAPQQPCHRKV